MTKKELKAQTRILVNYLKSQTMWEAKSERIIDAFGIEVVSAAYDQGLIAFAPETIYVIG